MEYRSLKHTNLTISRLSLGTMTFGSQVDEPAARSMVDRCLDAGINFFDTANVYNNGAAESILRKSLAGRRDKVTLASKVRSKMGEGPEDSGLSRAAIHKAIDQSLKRLGTSYLDVYYLHWPDDGAPIEETLTAMDALVRAGKVRYPAVSNYAAWQVAEIHCLAASKGFDPPLISQPMYNLLARGIEEEYVPFCKRFGVAILPYNPLAGGFLTGRYHRTRDPKGGGRFNNNSLYQDRYWHDDYFAAVESLDNLAQEYGKTLVELSLQWLLSQPHVDSVILGASRLDQLEENLRACEGPPLADDAITQCDAVWKRLRGVTPKYNR